ncbi:hypothetical protein MTsPCn9_25260 [Croceitalea sp. MTPC9]|uniref:DUF6326 family protein n=1 Tax=unclassified Croceitalea TaxID=2632280 RepID=UPI002B36467B|nr:hypothetical protein MTsPCn6_29270 [Croceitalea sp. MTPC6]GMN17588.1 hypothetical protein MTsPCn9_25260 [Croceitalea sp. MTPC9]
MLRNNVKPRALISSLWVLVLFNMILRDLHEFPTEGYIEEMIALKLPEGEMLFYAFLVEIPIAMIVLSRILKTKTNKWANIFAITVSSLGILYTLPGHMDEIFFATVNTIAFIVIIGIVWKLPTRNKNHQLQ